MIAVVLITNQNQNSCEAFSESGLKIVEQDIKPKQNKLEFVFYVKTDVSPLSTCMSKICKQEL